ncbi:hypothetical protein AB0K89_30605, partial [Streptomyces cinnamoneus]
MTWAASPVPAAVFAPRTAAARARALVLAPVLPQWDEGAFFAPVVRALTGAGVHVTVVDTLAAWDEDVTSLAALADRWHGLLPRFGPFDLLCGNALGGALAQALLPSVAPDTGVLLVSAPTVADTVLEQRLTEIADAARAGDLAGSLALLDHYVSPGTPGEDVRVGAPQDAVRTVASGTVRPGTARATTPPEPPGRAAGAARADEPDSGFAGSPTTDEPAAPGREAGAGGTARADAELLSRVYSQPVDVIDLPRT